MYRIIACDLDETLLNDERQVSTENIEAIRAAKKLGVKFVPATGRGHLTLQHTLKDLGLYDEADEYVISLNGAVITENRNNRILTYTDIPYETVKQLFDYGLTQNVCIHIYTLENVYTYRINEDERAYLVGRVDDYIEVHGDDIDFLKETPLMKILFESTDYSLLVTIRDCVKPLTEGRIEVSFSSNRYLEFNQAGVDKGKGLLHLAELLNISQSETIAIGDNLNDYSMVKTAGLGVSVLNARQELKDVSDYVCRATNNEHAIKEVIDRFIIKRQ